MMLTQLRGNVAMTMLGTLPTSIPGRSSSMPRTTQDVEELMTARAETHEAKVDARLGLIEERLLPLQRHEQDLTALRAFCDRMSGGLKVAGGVLAVVVTIILAVAGFFGWYVKDSMGDLQKSLDGQANAIDRNRTELRDELTAAVDDLKEQIRNSQTQRPVIFRDPAIKAALIVTNERNSANQTTCLSVHFIDFVRGTLETYDPFHNWRGVAHGAPTGDAPPPVVVEAPKAPADEPPPLAEAGEPPRVQPAPIPSPDFSGDAPVDPAIVESLWMHLDAITRDLPNRRPLSDIAELGQLPTFVDQRSFALIGEVPTQLVPGLVVNFGPPTHAMYSNGIRQWTLADFSRDLWTSPAYVPCGPASDGQTAFMPVLDVPAIAAAALTAHPSSRRSPK